MTKNRQHQLNLSGFTLIELLIATLIFSIVLLLCTFGILQVTRTYYKGITAAKTQQTTRSALDRISQAIQFSGGTITPSITANGASQAFCISDQRYSFILGKKLVDGVNHVLVVDSPPCTSSSVAQDLNSSPISGQELLAPNMRLAKMSISPSGTNLYQITIRVVYGDDDLLCSPSANDCSSTAVSTNLGNNDLSCKNYSAGTQFCAVSELSTVVQKRVK